MTALDAVTDALPGHVFPDGEHLAVWAVALLVLGGIAWSVAVAADDVRDTTPDVEFVVSFDADTQTLTVGHAGGEPVSDRMTRRLVLQITDAETDTTARVTWASDGPWYADRGSGYPVSRGDTLAVDGPTVDTDGDGNYLDAEESVGFELTEGDHVRVVWKGVGRSGKPTTETLANTTLVPRPEGTIRQRLAG